jgi:hypothetical protein
VDSSALWGGGGEGCRHYLDDAFGSPVRVGQRLSFIDDVAKISGLATAQRDTAINEDNRGPFSILRAPQVLSCTIN